MNDRSAISTPPASGDATRHDGRLRDALRPLRIERGVLRLPAGSALVRMGETQVLCAATVSEEVPPFLRGKGEGWVTAEYGMLPGSVSDRAPRNKVTGRAQEIQRLIGRSLRAVVDRTKLGERTITLDCDVLEADGGTRTAAISGAYVALASAIETLLSEGKLIESPLTDAVAAVSVGIVDGVQLLDLCYREDVRAEVDFNVVATRSGRLIELQGTAEHGTFTPVEAGELVALALSGIAAIGREQARVLAEPPRRVGLFGEPA
ncbi:MAG: ribonuclease PH [Candidatus Eisenbacteria bacterium]|nr:ribonuclease PH [Candidatus Eisenbacteria bacterium]